MIEFKHTPNTCHKVDNKVIWNSRSVAVVGTVIVLKNGEYYVLCGKRGKKAMDNVGLYNLPCGYLDWDETGSSAVIREIYEETGLYIPELLNDDTNTIINKSLEQPWYVQSDPSDNRQNVSLHYGVLLNIHKKDFPKLSLEYSEPDEVEEAVWIKITDLNTVKWAYNHDKVILKLFNNYNLFF